MLCVYIHCVYIYVQLDRAHKAFPVCLESVEHVSAVIFHRLCFKPASGMAAQLGQCLLFPEFPFSLLPLWAQLTGKWLCPL